MKKCEDMTPSRKRSIGIAVMTSIVLLMLALAWVCGKPLIQFADAPEQFRAWVDGHGLWGRLGFIGMVSLHVIIAFIPGEPFELAAGYAFGAVEGTILCIIGTVLGSAVVFFLVHRFGVKLVNMFFSANKINSIKFLQNEEKRDTLFFIIFLIPGTPKDLLSYFVGLTDTRFSTWMLIAGIARLPSLVTSTVCGNALGSKNYWFAVIVFVVTMLISGLGLLLYRAILKKHKAKEGSKDA